MAQMSVDPKVYDLAKSFLDEVKAKRPITGEDHQELAEAIQGVIEDFIGAILESYSEGEE